MDHRNAVGPWLARIVHTNELVRNILWIDDKTAQYGQTDDPARLENDEIVVHTIQARKIIFDYDRHVARIYP